MPHDWCFSLQSDSREHPATRRQHAAAPSMTFSKPMAVATLAMGRDTGFTHIFVDNSNTFLGAQLREDGSQDSTIRINIGQLIKRIEMNRACVVTRHVAGSRSPGDTAVWKIWEQNHYVVHVGARIPIIEDADAAALSSTSSTSPSQSPARPRRREAFVDEALFAAISAVLTDASYASATNTLVLLTGDGNEVQRTHSFPKLAEHAARHGWRVEIWAWKATLNRKFNHLSRRFPETVEIKYLDEIRPLVTFHQQRPATAAAAAAAATTTATASHAPTMAAELQPLTLLDCALAAPTLPMELKNKFGNHMVVEDAPTSSTAAGIPPGIPSPQSPKRHVPLYQRCGATSIVPATTDLLLFNGGEDAPAQQPEDLLGDLASLCISSEHGAQEQPLLAPTHGATGAPLRMPPGLVPPTAGTWLAGPSAPWPLHEARSAVPLGFNPHAMPFACNPAQATTATPAAVPVPVPVPAMLAAAALPSAEPCCFVCDGPACIVLQPCGHTCLCAACGKLMWQRCPMCHTKVRRVLRPSTDAVAASSAFPTPDVAQHNTWLEEENAAMCSRPSQ